MKSPRPLQGGEGGVRGSSTAPSTALPAKAEGQRVDDHLRERVWIPAFAGNTEGGGKENKAPYGPSGHFPQRGKIKGR